MEYRDKSFAKANETCCTHMPVTEQAPMPNDTIKSITGNNYKAACEIDYVLRTIIAQVLGVDMDKPDAPGENTLEAALICTNKLLNSIVDQLHCFANHMGVET